jgi:peptidoglycan/LPS O-acetylase OafA/YrhL
LLKIKQSELIKSLSSLRFVFALMVFIVHTGMFGVAIGHAFFIILSGFILTHVYEKRLLEKQLSFKDFFVKRLHRIYPLYGLTLLVSIPIAFYELYLPPFTRGTTFVLNFLSLQTLIPKNFVYFSYNGVSWNAADLLIFYACFPLILLVVSKLRLKTFGMLMAFATVTIIILMNVIPHKYHHYVFYINPFLRIADFILGIFLYKLLISYKQRPGYKTATVLEIVVLIFNIIWYGIAVVYITALTPYLYSVYFWLPLMLLISVFYFDAGYISKRLLSLKTAQQLGALSYSFYMIHQLVLRYAEWINQKYFEVQPAFTYFTVCFLITLLLAYLSSKYFEPLFYKNRTKLMG